MKSKLPWYLVAVLAIIIVVLLAYGRSAETPTLGDAKAPTTTAAGSSASTGSTAVKPGTGVVTPKPTTNPNAPGKPVTSAGLRVTPIVLPTYYAQQIASTTLDVHLSHPPSNATVASPMVVDGEARGSWYFEATFPIKLLDSAGHTIASGAVRAQADWMTSDFVPFNATLTFPRQPLGSKGRLILMNDNPSGLEKNAKAVEVEVTF